VEVSCCSSSAVLRLRRILESPRLQDLIVAVAESTGTARIVIRCDSLLSAHGMYLNQLTHATILVHPVTGLNESNLAHELIHALLKKQGYPMLPQRLFADKREEVVVELCSNITHVALGDLMSEMGFTTDDTSGQRCSRWSGCSLNGGKEPETDLTSFCAL